jgi:hypothetical protein
VTEVAVDVIIYIVVGKDRSQLLAERDYLAHIHVVRRRVDCLLVEQERGVLSAQIEVGR